jgi:hypothetical protein
LKFRGRRARSRRESRAHNRPLERDQNHGALQANYKNRKMKTQIARGYFHTFQEMPGTDLVRMVARCRPQSKSRVCEPDNLSMRSAAPVHAPSQDTDPAMLCRNRSYSLHFPPHDGAGNRHSNCSSRDRVRAVLEKGRTSSSARPSISSDWGHVIWASLKTSNSPYS